MKANATLRYEDAAETVTVTGWACKTCRRWYGKNEHVARRCCAKDTPCKCGGRATEGHTTCDVCLHAAAVDRWLAAPRAPWDGKTPLYSDAANKYFIYDCELLDYIEESRLDDEGEPSGIEGPATAEEVESLRLRICKPVRGRDFNIAEQFEDRLPDEDDDFVVNETGLAAEKAVNDWIKAIGAVSYEMTRTVPTTESILGTAKADGPAGGGA